MSHTPASLAHRPFFFFSVIRETTRTDTYVGDGPHPARRGGVEAGEHRPQEPVQESGERELRDRDRQGTYFICCAIYVFFFLKHTETAVVQREARPAPLTLTFKRSYVCMYIHRANESVYICFLCLPLCRRAG